MSGHDDDGFERLLRGDTPGTSAERDLGAFVDDVREAFPAQPLLAGDVHLVRITEAARLLADKGDPVARPVSNAAERVRHASGLPKRRETIVRVPVYRSLAAKVVAGLVVLLSMFGGVAFAGALPGGVQDKVANAVAAVVDLPGSDDAVTTDEPADPVETESPDPAETEDPVETESPDPAASESDGQGEDGDNQGEDDTTTVTETGSDDQGEDGDNQGEDGDNQGEDESGSTSSETETGSDDQGDDQGDTQDGTETDDQDQNEQ
ncbi:MAG: hypothetical protein ACM3WR_04280 [Solirubrobacterales bacterium]